MRTDQPSFTKTHVDGAAKNIDPSMQTKDRVQRGDFDQPGEYRELPSEYSEFSNLDIRFTE